MAKHWNNKSVACLVKSPEGFVQGYAIKMTLDEVSRLVPYEGYPRDYDRINVKLMVHTSDPERGIIDTEIDGQVYFKQNTSSFHDVWEAYLRACCKTLYYH